VCEDVCKWCVMMSQQMMVYTLN